MTNSWENILTGKQKEQLISNAVNALENLVNLPETNGILKDIEISERGGKTGMGREIGGSIYIGYHYQSLCLAKNGLIEKTICGGHSVPNFPYDGSHAEYCDVKPKEIQKGEYRKIIEDYKLTPTQILEIYAKLTE